jgi:hypothetical protein
MGELLEQEKSVQCVSDARLIALVEEERAGQEDGRKSLGSRLLDGLETASHQVAHHCQVLLPHSHFQLAQESPQGSQALRQLVDEQQLVFSEGQSPNGQEAETARGEETLRRSSQQLLPRLGDLDERTQSFLAPLVGSSRRETQAADGQITQSLQLHSHYFGDVPVHSLDAAEEENVTQLGNVR